MTSICVRRPSDMHEDCKYWGLSPQECRRHHFRLADFRMRRTMWFLDKSIKSSDRARNAASVAATAAAVAAVLIGVWQVIS